MVKPFRPHQPEKTIQVKITAREANLVKVLRKYPYGKFLVHKAEDLLLRIEITDSRMINEEDGLDLAVDD